MDIISILTKVFKLPPHSDSHFCAELYAMKDTTLGSIGILRLGGAKLKFALPTAQSIPKACLIKCFSFLQKTEVRIHLWNYCCVYSVLSNAIQVKGSLSKLSYLHEAGEPSQGLPDWHLLG